MTHTPQLLVLEEPKLLFAHGQAVEDPRDGLTLFGPLEAGAPNGIRSGVIGTRHGIDFFRAWVQRIQGPLFDKASSIARPMFPGFEAAFHIPWSANPVLSIEVPEDELTHALAIDDRHVRVHRVVGVFADRLLKANLEEEASPTMWFVVVPDDVYQYCRPKSVVPSAIRVQTEKGMSSRRAKQLRDAPSLFPDENEDAVPYHWEVDFHNQLKARLLKEKVLSQVLKESTVFPIHGIAEENRPANDSRPFQAAIAWNVSTTAFYKAGGRPWRIDGVREGVCYIGLVFKRDQTSVDPRSACCAAQMFLDSGDGIVFKGAVGPWYSERTGDFHLSRSAARELVSVAVQSFRAKRSKPPSELFIHGRVAFSDDEWDGFRDSVDPNVTSLVGVGIRGEPHFRLFRDGTRPVLRGTCFVRNRRSAYLWTKGFVARLRTYVGREVPRPLRIDVLRGDADIEQVLRDILALTKLNYNGCMFADGMPVTLRFADAVGEILVAGPLVSQPPLPFKHYI